MKAILTQTVAVAIGAWCVCSYTTPVLADICYWRGTGPICEGSCQVGERVVERKGGIFTPFSGPQEGLTVMNKFGEPCITGSKVLCCRPDPQAAQPPPQPQAAPQQPIKSIGKAQPAAPKQIDPLGRALPADTPIRQLNRQAIQGVAPPAPQPATATATVNGDVDVYDVPGGVGTVIGMLRQGSQVPLGVCRDDRWCQVTGVGWVWGDFLTR
jgi:hypothetical protein